MVRLMFAVIALLVAVSASFAVAQAPQPAPSCEDQLKLTAKFANSLGGELNALRVRNASLEIAADDVATKLAASETQVKMLKAELDKLKNGKSAPVEGKK